MGTKLGWWLGVLMVLAVVAILAINSRGDALASQESESNTNVVLAEGVAPPDATEVAALPDDPEAVVPPKTISHPSLSQPLVSSAERIDVTGTHTVYFGDGYLTHVMRSPNESTISDDATEVEVEGTDFRVYRGENVEGTTVWILVRMQHDQYKTIFSTLPFDILMDLADEL